MRKNLFRMILLVSAFPVAWLLRSILPVQAASSWDSTYRVGSASQSLIDRFAAEIESSAAGNPLVFQKFSVQGTGAVPLNLVADSLGHIWFSAANSDQLPFTLGELNPVTRQLTVRSGLNGIRRIHFIASDPLDRIWYITTYASSLDPDVLGVYDPASNEFREWKSDQFVGLYGLKVNQQNNEVWFVGTEPAPVIFRFVPATSTLTSWPIDGYVWAYDLSLDANGDVWVTDIPWLGEETTNSTILQLDPVNDQLTIWPLPNNALAPFKLSTANPGEVWFTEYLPAANSLARLNLSNNKYERFNLPVAASYPGSLAVQNTEVLFNAPGIFSLGRLSLPAAPDSQTTLTPLNQDLVPSNPLLTSDVYDHTDFATASSTVPFTSPLLIQGNQTNNFSTFPIPSPGCSVPAGGPWAHGILHSTGNKVWFSGCNYLGFGQDPKRSYLPIIIQP